VLEVRAVDADAFQQIYPLLLEFKNAKMSEHDWRKMLFAYSWEGRPERGFALYADGELVGFLGTIFSKRRIAGREQLVCNTSSWFVREAYRTASMLLLKPVLALRDCTIVNLTPTPRSYDIFKALGFKPLESERLLLPALASSGLPCGSFISAPNEIEISLDADESKICRELSEVDGVYHVLLRRANRQCYLVATRLRVKNVPLAELHYIGDREFFWQNRALANWALFRTMRVAGIAVDSRFAGDRRFTFAIHRSAKRLYRQQFPDTPPDAVDNLYSELMTVKI
jgi:hypothetical protein